MGLLMGEYEGRSDGFAPGGLSFENGFCPHGGAPFMSSLLGRRVLKIGQYLTRYGRVPLKWTFSLCESQKEPQVFASRFSLYFFLANLRCSIHVRNEHDAHYH